MILGNYGPHNECPNRGSTTRAPGRCLSVQEELAEQFVREKHGNLGGPELDSLRNKIFFEAEKKRAYCNIEETRYIHLSDGGLTDNLGVDTFLARANDPSSEVYTAIFQGRTKAVVIIAVNAATAPSEDLGEKPEGAWFGKIILRGIDLMMERVAWESLDATRNRIVEFERKVRRIQPDFRAYLLEITFDDLKDPARRRRLNQVGTRLALPEDQVSDLIAAGRELLESGRNGDNGRDLRRIIDLFRSGNR
jgi:NTE family protein